MIALWQRHERLYLNRDTAAPRTFRNNDWGQRWLTEPGGASETGHPVVDASAMATMCAGVVGAVVLVLFTSSAAAAGLAGVGLPATLFAGRGIARSRRDRHRSAALIAGLPMTVDAIARSLRSGMSLGHACESAARTASANVGDELTRVAADISHGLSAADAFRAWGERWPLPEVRLVAAALAMASQHQGGAAQALSGVANGLRDRAALADEIRSLTAQAAASMQAMVGLPVAFLVLDAATNRRVVVFLMSDSLGRVCLFLGAALNIAGWVWMRAAVRRRLPQ